jgi:type I restriction enzyme S subunit
MINKFYLVCYLNSASGKMQMLRFASGGLQGHVNLTILENLKVPILDAKIQHEVEQIILRAYVLYKTAITRYHEAEQLLLHELGLEDWQPPTQTVVQKNFSDFLATGRLDAEYYQPKYDAIEQYIKSFKDGFTTVGIEFVHKQQQAVFDKSHYNYVEIGDINVGNGGVTFNQVETSLLPANAKYALQRNDILVSTVRPYRGAVAIIDTDTPDLIASGAFTVLHENGNYKCETLSVLLRTNIYKEWLLKWNVGSSYPVIRDENVLNLLIPKLNASVQSRIAEKIRKSFDLRTQSQQLLSLARYAVETAIEQGEDKGLEMLEKAIPHE